MTSPDIQPDPFFDVPREVVSTSAGDIELPIFYFDGFAGTALFAIDAKQAAATLQGTSLTPLEHNDTATAAITFYDYRDTSLGPYQEVALAILVAQPGNYIVDLPVTTRLACAVGRELWGYPKFVADISIDADGEEFQGRLCDEAGELILTLSGRPGLLLKQNTPGKDIVTYSQRVPQRNDDGVPLLAPSENNSPAVRGASVSSVEKSSPQLLRTAIPTSCYWDACEPGSLALTIGDSGHAMTSRLRELGLAGATPVRWQTTRAFRSRLPRGESAG